MQKKTGRKPQITIARSDHEKLSAIAASLSARMPDAADELLAELDRARIAADCSLSGDVIRMGSTVRFKPDTGEEKLLTLVYPGEADIAEGKISVLTPIGTALIGLAAGQSITWAARDGREHELTVLSVTQPDEHPSGAALVPAEA